LKHKRNDHHLIELKFNQFQTNQDQVPDIKFNRILNRTHLIAKATEQEQNQKLKLKSTNSAKQAERKKKGRASVQDPKVQCQILTLSLKKVFISSFLLWYNILWSRGVRTFIILKIMIISCRLHILLDFLLSGSLREYYGAEHG